MRPFVKQHLFEFIGIAIGTQPDCADAPQLALKMLNGLLTRSWFYLERIKVVPISNGLITHYLSGGPSIIIPNLLQIFGFTFDGLQQADIGRLAEFDALFLDLLTSEKAGVDIFLQCFRDRNGQFQYRNGQFQNRKGQFQYRKGQFQNRNGQFENRNGLLFHIH
jgi:hypothetical protein